MKPKIKQFRVRVCAYRQINYIIRAATLARAKELYSKGIYDERTEGGAMDGETVQEDWEQVSE
jgi:hypothetical protein